MDFSGLIVVAIILIYFFLAVKKKMRDVGGNSIKGKKEIKPVMRTPREGKAAVQTINSRDRKAMGQKLSTDIKREGPSSSMKDVRYSSHLAMEDRSNDWLAKEMREERKALYRVSDMFQLKIEHSRQCEAELAREFHSVRCDADGIDTARVR